MTFRTGRNPHAQADDQQILSMAVNDIENLAVGFILGMLGSVLTLALDSPNVQTEVRSRRHFQICESGEWPSGDRLPGKGFEQENWACIDRPEYRVPSVPPRTDRQLG